MSQKAQSSHVAEAGILDAERLLFFLAPSFPKLLNCKIVHARLVRKAESKPPRLFAKLGLLLAPLFCQAETPTGHADWMKLGILNMANRTGNRNKFRKLLGKQQYVGDLSFLFEDF
jgi:hypothetical protein